jgi:hypothetical protein
MVYLIYFVGRVRWLVTRIMSFNMREKIIDKFRYFQFALDAHPKDIVIPINNNRFQHLTWDNIALLDNRELLTLVSFFSRLYKVEF